jgi:hypothetical protein
MPKIVYTQSYLKSFSVCPDTVLKMRVSERLMLLETQMDNVSLSNSDLLHHYTSDILVLKQYGALNSRVILQHKEIKDASFLFARLFFDQGKYNYWRREVEPVISSGKWERQYPLSKKEIEAAYLAHQNDMKAREKAYLDRKNALKNEKHVLDWCEQDWYLKEKFKS